MVGLQPAVAGILNQGDLLAVDLVPMPPAVSVVCKAPSGQIVGSLSAFLGLTKLIACMKMGVVYRAIVLSASSTRCTVIVRQAVAF